MSEQGRYTCQDYRLEMIILGLRRQLEDTALSQEERQQILENIEKLEAEAGLD